jgi:phosphoglycerate dehydrogenase-like enzyme
MKRLNVLLLPMHRLYSPWCDDVKAAIGARHNLNELDDDQPLAPQFAGIDVVVDQGGSRGTPAMMDAATDCKFWQVLGTGFDHFPLAYIKQKGIPTGNTPGLFSAISLAETAMMYMIMLSRKYPEGAQNFHEGLMYQPLGFELPGKTVGILGFGASGQELAVRAKAFGMRIMGIDVRQIEQDVLDTIQPDFMGTPDDLDRVVAESDYLSLHLHLNEETHHIIDARRLALMKSTASVINVARGALVDEDALYQALVDGTIGGAGLDVFAQEPADLSQPVYQLPNVIVTPHTAGVTDGTSRRRAACAAENTDRIAQGQEPLYRIDQ